MAVAVLAHPHGAKDPKDRHKLSRADPASAQVGQDERNRKWETRIAHHLLSIHIAAAADCRLCWLLLERRMSTWSSVMIIIVERLCEFENNFISGCYLVCVCVLCGQRTVCPSAVSLSYVMFTCLHVRRASECFDSINWKIFLRISLSLSI